MRGCIYAGIRTECGTFFRREIAEVVHDVLASALKEKLVGQKHN